MGWVVTKICDVGSLVYGIAVDKDGNIYYSCWSSGLHMIPVNSSTAQLFSNTSTRNLCYDGNNTLYACDWNSHSVVSFSIDTGTRTKIAGTTAGHKDGTFESAEFSRPFGIAMDKNGNLFVTDKHHVRKLNVDERTVSTIAGCTTGLGKGDYKDGEAWQSKFRIPHGIVVTEDGTIYLVDNNYCVRIIKDGIVSSIGTPGRNGNKDGPFSEAQFIMPLTLLEDGRGNLLVGEKDNNCLRKLNLRQGTVTSLKLADKNITNVRSMCRNAEGSLFLGTSNGIFKVETTWKWERYLWLGYLKEESSYCMLRRLPKEIIKEVCSHLQM